MFRFLADYYYIIQFLTVIYQSTCYCGASGSCQKRVYPPQSRRCCHVFFYELKYLCPVSSMNEIVETKQSDFHCIIKFGSSQSHWAPQEYLMARNFFTSGVSTDPAEWLCIRKHRSKKTEILIRIGSK